MHLSSVVRRASTVRVRTTVTVVIVFTLALGVGVVATVATVRGSLQGGVDSSIRLRAEDLASILSGGTPAASLTITDREDVFVQVRDRSHVVASTRNVHGMPPLTHLPSGRSQTISPLPGESGDRFRVFATSVRTPEGPLQVVVGRNLDAVQETIWILTRTLLLGSFLLLVAVGAAAWVVVARALRPVESVRSEVASISAAELSRRVSQPAGGDEVALLARTMNEMLSRLEAAQTHERSFVSDASHELRSPVTSIRHHAEVALSHSDRVSTRELASDVLGESVRLERLVEDLLLLARLSEQAPPSRPRPVDLDDVVLEEARRLRGGGAVRVDATGVSAARTEGDAVQLQRLVRNLGDNAARHARSMVAFTLREAGSSVVLRVDDDGSGIPPELRDKIFQRFARLDGARDRDQGGAGLGLAIVAEIVAAHGGTVEVRSSPMGGARFEVRLAASDGA